MNIRSEHLGSMEYLLSKLLYCRNSVKKSSGNSMMKVDIADIKKPMINSRGDISGRECMTTSSNT